MFSCLCQLVFSYKKRQKKRGFKNSIRTCSGKSVIYGNIHFRYWHQIDTYRMLPFVSGTNWYSLKYESRGFFLRLTLFILNVSFRKITEIFTSQSHICQKTALFYQEQGLQLILLSMLINLLSWQQYKPLARMKFY